MSLGAAIFGGAFSLLGGERANQASAAQAARQMRFQERMRDTAVQARVRDLRAAGINPILAAGQAASSPGGAMAVQQDTLTPAINTALAVKRQKAEIDRIEAQTALTKTQEEKLRDVTEPLGDAADLYRRATSPGKKLRTFYQDVIDEAKRIPERIRSGVQGVHSAKELVIKIHRDKAQQEELDKIKMLRERGEHKRAQARWEAYLEKYR